ncbi:hypothetical protein JXA27_06525 [Aerococcaceae bacterium zg-B36]|uniref:hypothetical protein n=1 Tax=Aerococcaceae bacterium zg-252 TaxID=2796928 RepID=UPI001BD864CE|nr:hypothetical protein [Aerococcaceae bacterium zg-B36]
MKKEQVKPMYVEKFAFDVVEEADYDKAYNGNNGNYETVAIMANDINLGEIVVCDWNIVTNDYVCDNLDYHKYEYMIVDNHVEVSCINGSEREYAYLGEDGKFYLLPDSSDID